MRHILLSLLVVCGAAVMTGCHNPVSDAIHNFEHRILYHPAPHTKESYPPDGAGFDDVWFASHDGTRLHGWFLNCDQPKAVVLYAHGNAGNISALRFPLEELRSRHDLTVMAFDYRGYGRSEGTPSEAGILADARAARAWLAQRTGLAERHIVLMGRSLGGGVMVDLASHDGARGLILESTFTSLPDVASQHIRWLPVGKLMQNRFDSLAKIGQYRGPLLQSHGDADTLIPYAQGERLFAAAPGPKRFITILGGDHNCEQTSEYFRALDEFIVSLPPCV